MRAAFKKSLRERLLGVSMEIDQRFSMDVAVASHPHLVAVRRAISTERWEFIALAFSPTSNRFFLEVAIARTGVYPITVLPMSPHDRLVDGTTRFRAFRLWSHANISGGWLIHNSVNELPNDTIAPPEGVFASPDEAIADVRTRIEKWILPYLQFAD